MKKHRSARVLAGLLSGVIAAAAIPCTGIMAAEYEGKVIYETGFEDGEIVFTGRGGVEVMESSTEQVYAGDYAMCVSGREKGWNGPQLLLDEICEPGVEYTVSAFVRAEWYNSIKLSLEYTDEGGERHYSNLASATNEGSDWDEFSEVKFSFTEDMTNVYLYFEANDTAKLYIDEFSLKEAPIIPIQDDIPSIHQLYNDYFNVGTAIMTSNLSSPSFMDLVDKHFADSITFGNELKPDSVLDQNATLAYYEETGDDTNPQVTLGAARSLLNYCRDNNVPVRGHVLVWHSQTPDWFFKEGYAADGEWVSKETMLLRMENYIKNVFAILEEEYPTVNIYAWDVVNEAWLDNGSPRTAGEQGANGSNNSAWVQVFGDNSFIKPAFEYARKYAPEGTKLYYNDFNEYMPQKTDAIIAMAEELKAEGLIDGIGLQSHLDVGFPQVSVYEKALAKFAETGLDIQITELDITTSDTTEAGLETQAQIYSDIFDVLVKYSDAISAVVLWGVTDDVSWRADRLPLLFDGTYQAKPAYYSIVDGLELPDLEQGDVNINGSVELVDVITLQKYILAIKTMSAQQLALADMNADGKVNGYDLALLKRAVMG
ncbi:MAG: endo-1,4-beta-xylanase [Oscillospiraceae bacterium]|nr:endo-1,4-beta-xylanase [Oscillospiraceae bacterium]